MLSPLSTAEEVAAWHLKRLLDLLICQVIIRDKSCPLFSNSPTNKLENWVILKLLNENMREKSYFSTLIS